MQKNEDCIAVYSRKSKFTGKGESIANQVDLCRDYVCSHYGEEALQGVCVYEDEGFSGGDLERPGFQAMMRAARGHKFKAIVVYRLDRISRNIGDFSHLIEELGRLDVAFVSIKEQFDTGTPMGRAMMYIASVFSQLERETIAERIRDNMHELAKTGRWLGGVTPTGYASESVQRMSIDGKTKKTCKLRLLPQEATRVALIYDLFLQSGSLSSTEASLLKLGILTKNGRPFTRFSIKAILQNPVYLIADQRACRYFQQKGADLFSLPDDFDGRRGMLAYHRTEQSKGKPTRYLPACEWIVCVGEHPGIVAADRWILAQELLQRNRSETHRPPRGSDALLSGLLYCRCGGRMYPKLTGRTGEDGLPRYTYVCKQKERSRRSLCARPNVDGNALDAVVLRALATLPEEKSAFADALEQHEKSLVASSDLGQTLQAGLREEREDAEKKIAALVDALADMEDAAARRRVSERIEALHHRSEQLFTLLAQTQSPATTAPDDVLSGVSPHSLCDFSFVLDRCPMKERRELLRTLLQRAVWDGECVALVLWGASQPQMCDTRDAPCMPPTPGRNQEDL